MSEKYKILSNFVKDMSSETPDVESYLSTKNNINKYELDIDISSKPLKNKLIEVNTSLKFQNKTQADKKSYFEIVYASIVQIEESIKEKKDLQILKINKQEYHQRKNLLRVFQVAKQI